MDTPNKRPDVIMIPHRPGRSSRRLILPIGVMLLAALALTLRATSRDWRGLWQEIGFRAESLFARKAKAAKPAVELAKAEHPAEPAKAEDQKDKAAPAGASKDKAAAWDNIKRDVEKAQADRDEAERIKKKAAEDLAKNPPPPPTGPRGLRQLNPAQIAEIQRQRAEMLRQMQAQMEDHQRRFEEMVREQFGRQGQEMEPLLRGLPRGFGNLPRGLGFNDLPQGFGALPPEFEEFFKPLPGMDRMNRPLPGMARGNPGQRNQPQVQEDSGEKVIDGVRWKWRTRRTTMIGGM